MRRAESDGFELTGVSERLAPYDFAGADDVETLGSRDDDLVERAATLLLVMPRNQRRKTIEELISPNDGERARRAVDALIESAFAFEDEAGFLRRAN